MGRKRLATILLALLIGFVEIIHSAINYDSILFDIYWVWHSRYNQEDTSTKIYHTIILSLCLVSTIMWAVLLAKLSYEIYSAGITWGGLLVSIPPALLVGFLVNDLYRFIYKLRRLS